MFGTFGLKLYLALASPQRARRSNAASQPDDPGSVSCPRWFSLDAPLSSHQQKKNVHVRHFGSTWPHCSGAAAEGEPSDSAASPDTSWHNDDEVSHEWLAFHCPLPIIECGRRTNQRATERKFSRSMMMQYRSRVLNAKESVGSRSKNMMSMFSQ